MDKIVNNFLDDLRGGRMAEAPVVTVEQGKLQGKVTTSPDGKAYYSFQGIPYAKPPLGSLRFKAPQPAEPWDGIRDATSEGSVCPQIDPILTKVYIGDENCLYLNIYTPNLDGEFLPVMFYIHGGGLQNGSGNTSLYGPDYLVEKDVIVVTVNYRLSALGFLNLNTPEISGNAGIKDIILALRWVNSNIHKFGGNSGNVTVFGESAGGITASLLTAYPGSKDLMRKCIIQSGTALMNLVYQKSPIENAKNLVKELGGEYEDVDDIQEFLTATPAKELIEAALKLSPETNSIFSISIEKEFPDVEAVITEPFYNLLSSGRVADVPIMIGSTTLEFTFERKSDDLQDLIPESLHVERNSEEAIQIANKLKTLYFKGSHTGVESMKEYFELFSDYLVNVDIHRYVNLLVRVTNSPVYYYKFDYVGMLNWTKKLISSLGLSHAGHLDDLGYLFSSDVTKDVQPSPQDVFMRERMVRLWTNFAKTSNPTPEENEYITVTWQPVTPANLYYLTLGNELSLSTNLDKEKMDFWDELYNKHFKIWNQNPQVEHTGVTVVPKPDPVIVVEELEKIPVEPQIEVVDAPLSEPEIVPEVKEDVSIEPVVENNVEIEAVVDSVEEKAIEVVNDEEKAEVTPKYVNGNGVDHSKARTSNEIKMAQFTNGSPKDVIRANDPPEDDLPKNIGVNKFVNFFESLGGKK